MSNATKVIETNKTDAPNGIAPDRTFEEIFGDDNLIADALETGIRLALWRHKRLGQSIVVWRDGKVVWIPAEEIEVDAPR